MGQPELPASPRRLFSDPLAPLWLIGGLILIAYGGYRLYETKGQSRTAALLLAVGLTMIPIPIIAFLGGVGLVGVGVWMLTLPGKFAFDYVIMLLAFVFGIASIVEQWRKLRASRS